MHTRINKIITDSGLTKTDFGKRINLSQGMVSRISTGTAVPSDRTIADICREFGVNRIWLETGEGEPYTRLTVEEELAEIFGNVLAGDPGTKSRLIKAFARLPEQAYPLIEELILKMAADLNGAENNKTE